MLNRAHAGFFVTAYAPEAWRAAAAAVSGGDASAVEAIGLTVDLLLALLLRLEGAGAGAAAWREAAALADERLRDVEAALCEGQWAPGEAEALGHSVEVRALEAAARAASGLREAGAAGEALRIAEEAAARARGAAAEAARRAEKGWGAAGEGRFERSVLHDRAREIAGVEASLERIARGIRAGGEGGGY